MVDDMSKKTVNKAKKKLKKILNRYEKSSNVQLTAVKLLSFLVNDMLDYAQLSAGQFRKFVKKFNLVDSVKEIVNMMKFKVDELGIELTTNFDNFEYDSEQIIQSSNQ